MFNFRDIGGHQAEGGTVRQGLILRSNALVELTEPELRDLSEIGIVTAIDLREKGERQAEPSDLSGLDAEVHEVALVDGAGEALTPELLAFNLFLLRERGDRLAEVIRLLNAPGALPGVYFCSSGKDRTGLVSALILSALGVSDDAIVRDYAISETLLPESYREQALQRSLDGGMPESMIEDYREHGYRSPAPVMGETMDHLDREYGGATEYLLASGLSPDELDELRGKLVQTG